MPKTSTPSTPWVRATVVLLAAVVTTGALAITPAGGAADGLSRREKKQGDKRWINVGEKATSAATADMAANADLVDGLDSTQLAPAVSAGRTDDLVLTTLPFQTVLSASVTAARSSTLLATGTVNVEGNGGNNDLLQCELDFPSPAVNSPVFEHDIPDTQFDKATISLVWAQPVGQGMHTVELACNAGGTVTVDDASLTLSAHL